MPAQQAFRPIGWGDCVTGVSDDDVSDDDDNHDDDDHDDHDDDNDDDDNHGDDDDDDDGDDDDDDGHLMVISCHILSELLHATIINKVKTVSMIISKFQPKMSNIFFPLLTFKTEVW